MTQMRCLHPFSAPAAEQAAWFAVLVPVLETEGLLLRSPQMDDVAKKHRLNTPDHQVWRHGVRP